jgi:hypothetical protein
LFKVSGTLTLFPSTVFPPLLRLQENRMIPRKEFGFPLLSQGDDKTSLETKSNK